MHILADIYNKKKHVYKQERNTDLKNCEIRMESSEVTLTWKDGTCRVLKKGGVPDAE
jgi:hypothetical protein